MYGFKRKHIVRLTLIAVMALSVVAIVVVFRSAQTYQLENVRGVLETAFTTGKRGTWTDATVTLDDGRKVMVHMPIGIPFVPGARVELSVHVREPEGMRHHEYKFVAYRSQEAATR